MLSRALYAVRVLGWRLGTLRRRLGKAPDYVVFTLEGEYERLRPPPAPFWGRWLSPPPPSLQDLEEQFRTVANDPRVRGVVLHLRPLRLPPAYVQTLRDFILELRGAGKRVVAWASNYETGNYAVACACDEVLLQPGGSVWPLGLRQSVTFLKDALARVGLQADVLQISPYKTAADPLTRSEMSPEMREMLDWLLDSLYGQLVRAVAEGRGLSDEDAQKLIDRSPYTDREALEANVVDGIVNEEALPDHLQRNGKPARLQTWDEARKRLLRRPPERPGRYIALIRVEGDLVDGRSGRPPVKPPVPVPFVTNVRTGDLTVVQLARRALKDKRAAALVVFVDSGGGSATASEAMAAALERVAAEKPVVVAMGGVAASGGYYVSTPGRRIVAQPGTITGSIGVLAGKFITAGMLQKLRANREVLARGRRATLFDPGRPFSDEERRIVGKYIERTYDVFLERVAASRGLSREDVDKVGGGRVWTGEQALRHQLVDELGDLSVAIEKARELAGLDDRAPVRELLPDRRTLAPSPLPTSTAAGFYAYALEGLRLLQRARALYLCPLVFEVDDTAAGA